MGQLTADIGEAARARPTAGAAVVDPEPYVRIEPDGHAALHLVVENAHCANCIRAIEGTLRKHSGVVDARLNLTTRRLTVRWREGAARAADLVAAVDRLGYRTAPFDPERLASGADAEDRILLRSLAVAGFAAANVMLLSVSVWAGAFSGMGPATRGLLHWLSALVVLPALVYACRPFVQSAFSALRAGRVNMDVPIFLALLLTAGISLFETVHGGPHVYFDAAAMLLFFLLIGRYLDRASRARARSAAERLTLLGATAATVVDDSGNTQMLPVASVRPGMTVLVAAGDRVPVDGEVAAGRSELDTSLVTGETLPRAAGPGDAVYAGTLNLGAPLRISVTAADDRTLLSEIVRLMEAAQQGRSRYVRIADRAARLYAPTVHLFALTAFVGWYFAGGVDGREALLIAVSVLIITCPCALGLAAPVVQVVASGRLMKRGILLKSPDGLERLAGVDTVAFDKTGTLTLGRPELANCAELRKADFDLAASLAAHSRHPLCRSLAAAGTALAPQDVREEPGMGLAAEVEGVEVRLGNRDWCGVTADVADADGPELWLSRGDLSPVRFIFSDRIRPDAADAVSRLQAQGYGIELMSGDRPGAVAACAQALGIENWRAGMSPADKTARLSALSDAGHKVAMVGDGLNDAPSLAAAHASVSPSTAADISATVADIVFQGESLAPIVESLNVARRARRLMLLNFSLAFAYNAVAVPVAMAGLVTPLIAAAAMSASSLVVTLNALRLNLRDRWTF